MENKEYIPISQLSTAAEIDKESDELIISRKLNVGNQQYVSYKVSAKTLSESIPIPKATTKDLGGIKLSPEADDQLGKETYVKLTNNDEAYVSVPKADNKTIIEKNGTLEACDELKDLVEEADNIVKKNVTYAKIEEIPGKYIAGFEQLNGKIQQSSVVYKDIAAYGLSVVNTWTNPTEKNPPSVKLVDNRFKSLSKVAATGNYQDLINKPDSPESRNAVLLSGDQEIDGIKTFNVCPKSDKSPDGTNDSQLVNVNYLNHHLPGFNKYKLTWIYGSELYAIIGPLKLIETPNAQNTFVVDSVMPAKDRDNKIGWQAATSQIALTQSISNFDKFMIITADEAGGKDTDTQMTFDIYDVNEYIWKYKLQTKRNKHYDNVMNASGSMTFIDVKCDSDGKTYNIGYASNKKYASCNYGKCVYIQPNASVVSNGTNYTAGIIFDSNDDYENTLKISSRSSGTGILVGVIGMKYDINKN